MAANLVEKSAIRRIRHQDTIILTTGGADFSIRTESDTADSAPMPPLKLPERCIRAAVEIPNTSDSFRIARQAEIRIGTLGILGFRGRAGNGADGCRVAEYLARPVRRRAFPHHGR